MSGSVDSLCSIYSTIAQNELKTDNPDMDKVNRMLDYIQRYCKTTPHPPGETPEQLKPYLFEEGSEKTGTVIYRGKEIPRSALEKTKKEEK